MKWKHKDINIGNEFHFHNNKINLTRTRIYINLANNQGEWLIKIEVCKVGDVDKSVINKQTNRYIMVGMEDGPRTYTCRGREAKTNSSVSVSEIVLLLSLFIPRPTPSHVICLH